SAATLSSMLLQIVAVLGVALGALLLNASRLLRHGASMGLPDFRIAFAVVGLLAAGAAIFFLRLPPNAGTEVSGHRVRRRRRKAV
ncbi:MAG: MFS transporter, partial [Steroidobacterales bacterium]